MAQVDQNGYGTGPIEIIKMVLDQYEVEITLEEARAIQECNNWSLLTWTEEGIKGKLPDGRVIDIK
jgi:hypothetical protein